MNFMIIQSRKGEKKRNEKLRKIATNKKKKLCRVINHFDARKTEPHHTTIYLVKNINFDLDWARPRTLRSQ